MFPRSCLNRPLSALAVLALLLTANRGLQADPLTITSSVLPSGPNYLYDFAITNNSSTDPYGELVSVDFSLPAGSIIGSAISPAGNGEVTDPSGGFVEFTSNNLSGFPVGMPIDGFQFVSASPFGTLSFTANYLDQAETALTTFTGTTSPQTPAAVPEPGASVLLAGGILLLFVWLRSLGALVR